MNNYVTKGVALIATERERQITEEGWTAEHDAEYSDVHLPMAAVCYATPYNLRKMENGVPMDWPWNEIWWNPTPGDRVRELVKAGALIAAEIDRILNAENKNQIENGV